MKKICFIPARMGSSRFYGKPLEKALGIPLIIHVAKRCILSNKLDATFVATCDQEIANVCNQNDIDVVMTSTEHERCTDRVSEAVEKCSIPLNEEDFILMVQGDEILVTPEMINLVIDEYLNSGSEVINLLSRIKDKKDQSDPNVVKVVYSKENYALYFSRSAIPSTYRCKNAAVYQQTGVIGFANSFLNQFSKLSQTPLEKIESIDMLRVLENHLPLKIVTTERETVAVDMPYDLSRAATILQNDVLVKEYA